MSYRPEVKINSAGQTQDFPLDAETIQGKDIFDSNDIIKAIYLPTLTSAAITSALGYTPYDSSNPNGYITGITKTMVTTALGYTPGTSNFSGSYNDLSDKPTSLPANGGTSDYINATTRATDINKLQYSKYAGATDNPTTDWFAHIITYGSTNWYQELALGVNTDEVYFRRNDNGTIRDWKKLAFTSDIPTNVSAFTNDAGYLTQHQSLTDYATKTYVNNKSYLVTEGDNRTVATKPNDYVSNFVFKGLKTNTYIGSPSNDTYSYLFGLRGWSDSSGGNSHEIAFNDSGIYIRKGATTSWSSWAKVATIGDIPTSLPANGGNSDTVAGLSVHSGRNNESNKVVRTDGMGYIQASYINSSDGDENNSSSPARIWGTNGSDSYLRTYNASYVNIGGYSTYFPPRYDGGDRPNPQQYFGVGVGLRVAMARGASGLPTGSYWNDILWINGYNGGDVPYCCSLMFARSGEPRFAISTQAHTATSYGTSYEVVTAYNISNYALPNAGSSPNLNNGTTVTQPGGENAISIKTPGSAHDTGIFYMSQDNAYICNSSDNAYNFAVFDTDVTTDFSNEDNAEFVVRGAGNGCKIRGNTVLHTGNMPHLYRHKIHARIFSSSWITFDIFNTSATRIEISTLKNSLDDGYYTVTGSYGPDPITSMQIWKEDSDYMYISTYTGGEESTQPSSGWDDVSTIF